MKWIAKTSVLTVRPYQPKDRADLFRIASDTAFFGEPIEIYLDDRRIFEDSFYAFYTDYEPEHCWVATADDQVVGFLTGCIHTRRQQAITKKKILPKVFLRFFTGHYKIERKTWKYQRRLLKEYLQPGKSTMDNDLYPAHLHINVDSNWRGYGIGLRLMQTYFSQLRALNIPGVHLETTDQNITACRLYEKMGFQLVTTTQTDMWLEYLHHPVENRGYALKFELDVPD